MPVYTGDKFGFGKAPDSGSSAGAGEAVFVEPGQYDWVCPAGVTSVSVVCVGGGGGSTRDEMGGSGGGGLGYKNNISVTAGNSYKIQVGAGGVGDVYMQNYGASGGDSWFGSATTVKGGGGGGTGCAADGDHSVPGYGGRGGTFVGDSGGNGGNGGDGNRSSITGTGADTGGGGAGGYGGDGGQGGDYNGNWSSGTSGNNGAGGGAATAAGGSNEYWGGGGGGVSIYGKGRNGQTGSSMQYDWQSGGTGGSGGAAGWGNGGYASGYGAVNGGQFGAGGGSTDQRGGHGASGAVRIIWGTNRLFPKSGVDDFWSETITRYSAPTAGDPTTGSSNWFRGGNGEEDNGAYSSNYNYNGIVPNVNVGNLPGDFTLECWIYLERLADNTQTFGSGSDGWGAVIVDGRRNNDGSGNQLGSFYVSRGNTRRGSTGPYFLNYAIPDTPTGPQTIISDTECIQQCTWHHVALTRQNNYYWIWVDGVKVFTGTNNVGEGGAGNPINLLAQSDRPVIGGWGYGGRMQYWSWYGNISNFRMVVGSALYDSANASYTVPTFPLTSVSGSGSVGAHRYWRIVEGSAVYSHFPRVASISLNTEASTTGGTKLYHYTADNCTDTGVYQIGTREFDAGEDKEFTHCYISSVYGQGAGSGGRRAANYEIYWSDDNSNWNFGWSGVASNMPNYPNGDPDCGLMLVTGAANGYTTDYLCCTGDNDYEKDLASNTREWEGPNCMPSVLGPGSPTIESAKKGFRYWGRHRGLGGGTKTGQNGDPGDGGLLSTWKKPTGSFQTEQFGTHGGWSASASTADGIAIKVTPSGAYLTGDNATAKWNLKSISYGVSSTRARNSSVGNGPFIEKVHIKVMVGKNSGGTVIYDSGEFTLRLPSYNDWDNNGNTPSKDRYTSCAFEIELPNGGVSNLDMNSWYSVYIKGMAHPNNNNWNSTNGTPGANKQNFWYSEQPVNYQSNSNSYNEMRYAPKSDADEVAIRLEEANFNDTSWANNNHGNFTTGQFPFFGISMPINFMKDAPPEPDPNTHVAFTNDGTFTWTVPAGVTAFRVVVIGGGGSGSTYGAGAGGGAAMKLFSGVTPGTPYNVHIGAGGADRTNGQSGGNSVFQGPTTLTGAGGAGGASSNPGTGYRSNGGSGSGGTVNGTGGVGYPYTNDPNGTWGYLHSTTQDGTNGGGGGGGASSDNGDAGHGGVGSYFAGGGGGGGSDNGHGGDGGQGGNLVIADYSTNDYAFGGGGGGTDGSHVGTKYGGTGGASDGKDGHHSPSGNNPGGDGGGPTGGTAGQGNGQNSGGGGGASFGGGGGGAGHNSNPNGGGAGGGGLVYISYGPTITDSY